MEGHWIHLIGTIVFQFCLKSSKRTLDAQGTVVILITKTLQLMEIFDYVGENFHIQGPNMHYHWNKKIDTWKLNKKENEDKKDEFLAPREDSNLCNLAFYRRFTSLYIH